MPLFAKKDVIGLKDLSATEIMSILDTAETMKTLLNQKNKKAPHLQGKSVVLLFYNKSTRAKLSYELAAQYLSASYVDMTVADDIDEQTNLVDTGRIIDQMGGDFIILRHPMAGSAKLLSENVKASVINAEDGINENPSQSLLDLLTIKNHKGGFDGLKVTMMGDISYSPVSKSNIWGLLKLGAKVSVAAPPTIIPPELKSFGVDVHYDAYEAVRGADVIMVWRAKLSPRLPSLQEYKNFFKVDEEMVNLAKKDVIIMHPGPINRGIDISSKILDSGRHQCLVEDQIANGVAVRMAILYLLSLKGGVVL